MKSLPKEIQLEIFTHLSHADQRSISKTCSSFAHLVRPLLFSVLNFDGSPQNHADHGSRKKAVDIAQLETAVEEVLNLGIAPYVKTFQFSPKRYRKGFWRKYRQWVEDEIDREIDPEELHDALDSEEEEEIMNNHHLDWDERLDRQYLRLDEQRRTRLERERKLIEEGEKAWSENLETQQANEAAGKVALVKLFHNMTNLKRVEIGTWSVDIEEFGFVNRHDNVSDEVLEQFDRGELTWADFEFLASVLYTSGRHLKELRLPRTSPSKIRDMSWIRYMFTGLVDLDLHLDDVKFLELDNTSTSHDLPKLMQCALATLQRLKLQFSTDYLPERGEHTFENLLYEPRTGPDEDAPPLIFPRLKTLELSTLIVYAPSLARFLSVQPALETINFEHIYLGTPDSNWAEFASSFPPSLQSWYVNRCGHEPFPETTPNFQHPIGYNWIHQFKPFSSPLPPSCGWEAKDPFNETDHDPRLWINSWGREWRVRDRYEGAPVLTYQRKTEYVNTTNAKSRLESALFVRIGMAPVAKDMNLEEMQKLDDKILSMHPMGEFWILHVANSGQECGVGRIPTVLNLQQSTMFSRNGPFRTVPRMQYGLEFNIEAALH